MSNTTPASYRELLTQREQAFRTALQNGEIDPFVYPWDAIPAGILILAVLCLPTLNAKYSRWPSSCVFMLIVLSCISVMQRCRSLGLASGYGIGLMAVWGIIWSAVLLIYNDPRTAFQRLEWRDKKEQSSAVSQSNGSADSAILPSSSLRNRRVYGVGGGAHEPTENSQDAQSQFKISKCFLVWQSYPESLRHRLDWAIDLCTSFRGPGWNWHIQSLPAADYPSPIMPTTPPSSTRLLTRTVIRDFLICYLVLDIVKTAAMNDPYFWGIAPISSPAPNVAYLPPLITNSQPLIKLYRLLLSLAGVVSTLSFIFSLCPITFAVLFPLLDLTKHTRAPLLEPLLYPPYWGDFTTAVLDKGLAGWWGKWWHQMFRVGISEPSHYLLEKLAWNPRTQKAKTLQLVIAFAVSGTIHAGASYTTLNPETKPISEPFAFFFSQAFAILAEQLIFKTMGISNVMRSWPRALRRAGTLMYVLTWFYFTGPWLADDFARGGIWLFEPVPVSVVRGLGWGAEGEGWWCWHGRWAVWWSGREGRPWWRVGIAI
jgi:Membrane bound O-acyl transferase family